MSREGKSIETDVRLVVAGGGVLEGPVVKHRASFSDDGSVLPSVVTVVHLCEHGDGRASL